MNPTYRSVNIQNHTNDGEKSEILSLGAEHDDAQDQPSVTLDVFRRLIAKLGEYPLTTAGDTGCCSLSPYKPWLRHTLCPLDRRIEIEFNEVIRDPF